MPISYLLFLHQVSSGSRNSSPGKLLIVMCELQRDRQPCSPHRHSSIPEHAQSTNQNRGGRAFKSRLGFLSMKETQPRYQHFGLELSSSQCLGHASACIICTENRRPDEFPAAPVTYACTHPLTDVCKGCIRHYISSELSQRGTASVTCPVCRQTLSHADVRRHAAPEDFRRFDDRVAVEAMENDPRFRWCPNAGCGAGQIQALGDAEPKATCVRCHQPFCFVHRMRWHPGLTCGQYDLMSEEERQSYVAEETRRTAGNAWQTGRARYRSHSDPTRGAREIQAAEERRRREAEERLGEQHVQRIAKRCPGCQSPTEKVDGCKHMTCMARLLFCWIALADHDHDDQGSKCRFEWCWICQEGWIKGHLNTICTPS